MLGEADVRILQEKINQGVPNAGSNRTLDTLIRLTERIAALKLKQEADVVDARRAIDIYNKVNSQLQAAVDTPTDPATEAYDIILYVLQNESNGLPRKFMDMADEACMKSKSVEWYLKGSHSGLGSIRSNKKLRRVLEMLENHSSKEVRRTSQVPAEFLWIGDSESGSGSGSDKEDGGSNEGDKGTTTTTGGIEDATSKDSSTNSAEYDLCDLCDPTKKMDAAQNGEEKTEQPAHNKLMTGHTGHRSHRAIKMKRRIN